MRVILQKEVERLGSPGDIVVVADGYARNYLLPRGMAAPATKGAVRHAERLKTGHEERIRRQKGEAESMVTRLSRAPVRLTAQAGEDGRLFGSITSHQIADALAQQLGERVDHRRVRLDEPIRSLGAHDVKVRLHPEVEASLTIDVVAK